MKYRVIALLLLSTLAPAARGSYSEIAARFREHYHSHYQAGRCGENVTKFVRSLRGVADFYVVTVENKGFTVFGMVNAEAARGTRFGKPAEEERNWYHHVFALDSRGLVYDFDFTASPKIVPVATYLEKMFLNETECENPRSGEFCAGRANKMRDYELTAVPASDLHFNAGNERARKASLGEVLKNWRVLTR